MTMQPRVPFCAAEESVDYGHVDNVVLHQRDRVERLVWNNGARQLALGVHLHAGAPSTLHWGRVGSAFARACQDVYRAGYDQVVAELTNLRARDGRPSGEVAGGHRDEALRTLDALGRQAASSYGQSVVNYWAKIEGSLDEWKRLEKRARQLLHNVTLEIVGRSLNLGRTAAALGGEQPFRAQIGAALYAMRSEQLDTNTCGPCDQLHGHVAIVGSVDYFEHMPPNDCLGRGRCRGIYVFADRPDQLRIPGGQQRLPIDSDQISFFA